MLNTLVSICYYNWVSGGSIVYFKISLNINKTHIFKGKQFWPFLKTSSRCKYIEQTLMSYESALSNELSQNISLSLLLFQRFLSCVVVKREIDESIEW